MPNARFHNVQRLLVQEKGEEIYNMLARKKRSDILHNVQDRIRRRQLALDSSHFTQAQTKEQ